MDRLSEEVYSLSDADLETLQPVASSSRLTLASKREHNDSGYCIEANGSLSSTEAKGFTRHQPFRQSLKNLKRRSGKFFSSRFRPKCLKSPLAATQQPSVDQPDSVSTGFNPQVEKISGSQLVCGGSEGDLKGLFGKGLLNPPQMSVRRRRVVSVSAVRSTLIRQEEIEKISSEESMNTVNHCRSMKSSASQSTLHSVDNGIIWINSRTESRQTTPATSSENLCEVYRQVLSCLVNPLGCADRKPGCSPVELAEHLREIFQLDKDVHESFIDEVKNQRHNNVVVNVSIIEARDLKVCTTIDHTNPYCVLAIDSTLTPKSSPTGSPRSSPQARRRSGQSFDMTEDMNQTEPQKATVNPQWKDQFELPIKDLESQALHIFVMNSTTQSSHGEIERHKIKERKTSFKGIFRHFKLSMDSMRTNVNHLGQFRIALKDVPASGCDTWFQLYKDKKQKYPHQGQLRLRLQLAHKQTDISGTSLQECSVTEFHNVVLQVYKHALNSLTPHTTSPKQKSPPILTTEPFCRVSERSRMILNQFAIQSNISILSQCIIELAVVLELKITENYSDLVTDKLITDVIADVTQKCKEVQLNQCSLETEKAILNEAVSSYLRSVRSSIKLNNPLFPPTELHLQELHSQIGIPGSLLSLPLWMDSVGFVQSRQEFSSVFIHRLQDDVKNWVISRLATVTSTEKDPVIPKTRQFILVLQEAATALTPIISISEYFQRIGFDYFKVASLMMEVKISLLAQELTLEMDRYQIKYHRFDINIRDSSVVSLQHYFSLRVLFKTICINVNERELFRVSLTRYQDWFKGSVAFWLQTFREECQKRMEKALLLDKDVVQVTSQVKYSNSSVDILSSFAKMTGEWEQIDFGDADIALLGVTKITDMICDCVKLYAEKVIEILEKNGYYDYIDNQQFDVTDQLCISLNNVSHLSGYLVELSTLLHWDSVTEQLSVKHEDTAVGQMALKTLENLVQTTDEEMIWISRVLAQQIIERIAVDLRKYTQMFTQNPACGNNNDEKEVEPLLEYCESNLQVLYKKLESTIFPLFLEEIWRCEIKIFAETIMEGQPPEYYQKMLRHLNSLKNYFYGDCVITLNSPTNSNASLAPSSCKTYNKLLKTLESNSLTTESLILEYYRSLTNVVSTPVEYYGHLVVKAGYRQDMEGFVTLNIRVVQGKYLPGMTSKDLSNPFITLTLCPLTLFPSHNQHKTSVQQATINPVFGEQFEFSGVSQDHLALEGAVVIFSVWHHVTLLPDDFLGEVILPLARLTEITANQDIDDVPAVMMPLRRPREPRDGPYKVLKERALYDKSAELLLHQRSETVAFHKRCRFCKPVKCIMSTITGKKLEVVGKRDSINLTES